MSQITVDIDDGLLADLGRDAVERELADAIGRLELRRQAREAIEDLKEIDLTNDPDYQAGRKRAWDKYGHLYSPSSEKIVQ